MCRHINAYTQTNNSSHTHLWAILRCAIAAPPSSCLCVRGAWCMRVSLTYISYLCSNSTLAADNRPHILSPTPSPLRLPWTWKASLAHYDTTKFAVCTPSVPVSVFLRSALCRKLPADNNRTNRVCMSWGICDGQGALLIPGPRSRGRGSARERGCGVASLLRF